MEFEKSTTMQEKISQIYELQAQEREGREFWHYTSASNIIDIFKNYRESGDSVISSFNLYASSIHFLNDRNEYKDGKKHYNDYINEKKKIDRYKCLKELDDKNPDDANVYIISFCKTGDLLSQWKWYGKNSGVSFCFDADKAAYSTYSIFENNKMSKKYEPKYDMYTKPLLTHYEDEKKKKYFNTLLNKILIRSDKRLDVSNIDLLNLLFVPFCKDIGFIEEAESRLIFNVAKHLPTPPNCKARFNYVYSKTKDEAFKPALNISIKSKQLIDRYNFALTNPNKYKKKIKPLVNKMIVGPGSNQELVFNGLIHFFDPDNFAVYSESFNMDLTELKKYSEKTLPKGSIGCVKCSDGKKRFGYKCSNGLLILKSTIPFRG